MAIFLISLRLLIPLKGVLKRVPFRAFLRPCYFFTTVSPGLFTVLPMSAIFSVVAGGFDFFPEPLFIGSVVYIIISITFVLFFLFLFYTKPFWKNNCYMLIAAAA